MYGERVGTLEFDDEMFTRRFPYKAVRTDRDVFFELLHCVTGAIAFRLLK